MTNPDIARSQIFRFSTIKKNWGLIPLLCILGGSVTFSTVTAFYFLFTKPNVRLNRRADYYPYEYINGNEVRRLWKSPYMGPTGPIPEVEQLRKEIGLRRYPKTEH